jgi:predicted signal transduction protein with EAL and GGDEF domain
MTATKGITMSVSVTASVEALLETEAGNAVYDALVQSNIDPRSVPLEVVKTMLLEEIRFRRQLGRFA